MDWLRISLLLLGVVLVAGIWLAHRLRTRARRGPLEPEPEDWGEDGVHIRAHRDDAQVEPRLGSGIEPLSMPLEAEEDVSPVRKVGPHRDHGRQPEPKPNPGSVIAAPVRDPRPARSAPPTSTTAGDRKAASSPLPRDRRPPAESDFDDVSEPRVVGRNPLAARGGREKILILHVVAPRNRPFTGVALGAALRRAGLKLGEMSIYHFPADPDAGGEPFFSVANMIPPGTLTDTDLADTMTPGITLFLQVHTCEQPHKAFDTLLETSHVLARDLGGRILDAQQSTATNQTLAHMREEMNQWLLHHRPDLLRRKAER